VVLGSVDSDWVQHDSFVGYDNVGTRADSIGTSRVLTYAYSETTVIECSQRGSLSTDLLRMELVS
jgi:hypothetical protein